LRITYIERRLCREAVGAYKLKSAEVSKNTEEYNRK
jgi:hypothetical protein